MLCQVIYCITISFVLLKVSTETDEITYKAVVVEYAPRGNSLQSYLSIIDNIDNQTDIIVFPEATLTGSYTFVPDVSSNAIPCTSTAEYEDYLTQLSCAAANKSVYIVANLKEKAICTAETQAAIGDKRPCASNGYSQYNTNVAFDRNGAIVARYRKFNLFGEYQLNTTLTPDLTTFTTDYNVTYGMFTCFDIQFETPALTLIRNNITDIIFTTMWYSELPFLTALQVQQMFAQETNVNFLAAGANYPRSGSGGSGIYRGMYGPVVYGYEKAGDTKTYTAEMGKSAVVVEEYNEMEIDLQGKEMDDFLLIRDQVDVYTSVALNTSREVTTETLCHYPDDVSNKLCCSFYVSLHKNDSLQTTDNYYHYRLVVYSGIRTFSGLYNGGVEVCGIISCLNDTLESCAYRFSDYDSISWPTTFESIHVKGNFTNVKTRQQYPSSLLSNIRPILPTATEWTTVSFDNVLERSYSLTKPQNRLLSFAIYGRDFARDSDPLIENAANTVIKSVCISLLIFLICLI